MLKELSLYPFTNYRRVAIRQKMRFSQPTAYHFSCWSSSLLKVHLCLLAFVYLLSLPHPSHLRECECVCMYLYVSPFPRCLGAEGPSAGFLLSLLRGPQRPLIIPDLLDLPLSASHSGPLRLAQVSSLPMHSFLALFAPRTFKITPLLGSSR